MPTVGQLLSLEPVQGTAVRIFLGDAKNPAATATDVFVRGPSGGTTIRALVPDGMTLADGDRVLLLVAEEVNAVIARLQN
ncbi:hypothetical protein [Yinghuangia soli]|uniref:Uncharacterized protein n=1 Tax=Yinghuangia soli TaxID=2908204 RepID=A0AA41U4V1_9ACTN|nr:hypothetical protein [Yinghuangia soli]MCF2529379.1 hypothetical protein [Yinghuangia soli]